QKAPGPYYNEVRFKVVISGDRTVITIAFFPTIQTSFDTDFGTNTTTITRTGGGTGSYAAGRIVMPITLHFDHSIDIPLFEEDSDLSLELSTDPPGSPVTPEPFGNVTLVGSGQFIGGILGGSTGTLKVSGKFSAWTNVSEGRTTPGGRVTAVPWGQQIAVFVADPSGEIYTAAGDPQAGFGPWASVSEGSSTPGAPVMAVPWGQKIALFVADPNGGIYTAAGDPQAGF